jgi:hypothetical protein
MLEMLLYHDTIRYKFSSIINFVLNEIVTWHIFLEKHSVISYYYCKGVVYHILDLEHAGQHHMRDAEAVNIIFTSQHETNEAIIFL